MNSKYLHQALSSVTLAALIIFNSCSGSSKKEETAEPKENAPVVSLETVEERSVEQIGEYTATVEPDLINNISAATPNRIKEIYVDEGMRVAKGQRLVV
ncbi:MAG: efflux RND transporter periplasmic adaptor subunit, partial [Muribaculaceae bacterium]|nr:efflux RND transporter periplasmic adaptor subunit [Muribaculaceae bacterium]